MAENPCERCEHYRDVDHPEFNPPPTPGRSSYDMPYCDKGHYPEVATTDCPDRSPLGE